MASDYPGYWMFFSHVGVFLKHFQSFKFWLSHKASWDLHGCKCRKIFLLNFSEHNLLLRVKVLKKSIFRALNTKIKQIHTLSGSFPSKKALSNKFLLIFTETWKIFLLNIFEVISDESKFVNKNPIKHKNKRNSWILRLNKE